MAAMPVWRVDRIAHPVLPLLIALDAQDDAVVYVSLGGRASNVLHHAQRHGARVEVERRRTSAARGQLIEYLEGQRREFDLRVRPLGTTFQRKAWQRLMQIPFGSTLSYGEQAASLGMNNGARAVGGANGANPISIIVPCHRVVGSGGSMTGFGGGVPTKRWLLALEKHGSVPAWTPSDHVPSEQLGLFA